MGFSEWTCSFIQTTKGSYVNTSSNDLQFPSFTAFSCEHRLTYTKCASTIKNECFSKHSFKKKNQQHAILTSLFCLFYVKVTAIYLVLDNWLTRSFKTDGSSAQDGPVFNPTALQTSFSNLREHTMAGNLPLPAFLSLPTL